MDTQTSNLIIRPVELQEAETLLHIAKTMFLDTYAHLNTAENMDNYVQQSFTLAQITKELQHPESYFYFGMLAGEVIAYLKLNKGAAQTDQPLPDALEIERIYVSAAYHGRGVGKQLLDQAAVVATTQGLDTIWLGVWEENPKAIRFYEKNGFRTFGTHIFQLGTEVQTDLLMKLEGF